MKKNGSTALKEMVEGICVVISDLLGIPRRTSAFVSTATAPNERKTSLRAVTGSVARMFSALTTDLLMKPRASASAIWPAPMKPILLFSADICRSMREGAALMPVSQRGIRSDQRKFNLNAPRKRFSKLVKVAAYACWGCSAACHTGQTKHIEHKQSTLALHVVFCDLYSLLCALFGLVTVG